MVNFLFILFLFLLQNRPSSPPKKIKQIADNEVVILLKIWLRELNYKKDTYYLGTSKR